MTLATALARPPGPKNANLLLGVLPRFRKDPPGYLLEVARAHGDLAYMQLARQNAYLVSHPDLIRDILVTHQTNFTKSRMLERAKVLLGEGLLTSEGEFHHRQRRLVQQGSKSLGTDALDGREQRITHGGSFLAAY